jgi:hypothetical protein
MPNDCCEWRRYSPKESKSSKAKIKEKNPNPIRVMVNPDTETAREFRREFFQPFSVSALINPLEYGRSISRAWAI